MVEADGHALKLVLTFNTVVASSSILVLKVVVEVLPRTCLSPVRSKPFSASRTDKAPRLIVCAVSELSENCIKPSSLVEASAETVNSHNEKLFGVRVKAEDGAVARPKTFVSTPEDVTEVISPLTASTDGFLVSI